MSAASENTKTPLVLWAQRKDTLLLTIAVADLHGVALSLKAPRTVTFGATAADGTPYAFALELYGEVDVAGSKHTDTGRQVFCVIKKKDAEAPFWPRLTQEKFKAGWLKTDFNRWVDEDEEEAAVPEGGEGQAGAPGFMGGMDGMDFEQFKSFADELDEQGGPFGGRSDGKGGGFDASQYKMAGEAEDEGDGEDVDD